MIYSLCMVIAVGALIPAQAGMNAILGRQFQSPLSAAIANFTVGLVALLVLAGIMRAALPIPKSSLELPWWAWLGGFCGASLVAVSAATAPRLGAAVLVSGLVTGQLVGSLWIDHKGWFGYPVKEIGLTRLLGAAFLLVGVLLMTGVLTKTTD